MQFVEGVEELFLCAFLRPQGLNVVDQQHVRSAVPGSQLGHAFVLDSGDHFIRETLAGGVDDAHAAARHQRPADCMHQMGLAHSHAAIYEQRVVAARRVDRNGLRRRVRELIARPHDERVEREMRIQREWRFDFVEVIGVRSR